MNRKQKNRLFRILSALVLLICLRLALPRTMPWQLLYLLPYLVCGYDILLRAGKGLKNRQPFDECFLMAVATIGALALGDFPEAVAVMLFYQTGELFESIAVGKSRRSISELMDIRPDFANVELEDGSLSETDPEEVEPGTVIVIRPGERVPLDGTVLSGESTLDTSALTGESRPRRIAAGEMILSGSINITGLLRVETSGYFSQSTVARILELVENASSRKARSEAFISRFAAVYTPAVCFSALALAVLPPLIRLLCGLEALFPVWLYRALSFLVISCPCALVISIPLSFFAGIGAAGSAGILIKGSNYLEKLASVRWLVMDKTGTLTEGRFRVTEVLPEGVSREELLEIAALAESHSRHPIALSLREAFGREQDARRVTDTQELPGRGVSALVDGRRILLGNALLMRENSVAVPSGGRHGTVCHVAADGKYLGCILIADPVKAGSKTALKKLKSLGVKNTVMLTGDSADTAGAVAAELGIERVYARLLPEDKVRCLESLLDEKRPEDTLAFVGDGINDAPVLMRADIGIAMGALGSDAAIEAADLVLMDDDPAKIAKAVAISRKCLRIVRENIIFAIGVKLAFLLLSALGLAGMWWAIFADVGVMILAVLNALRCLKTNNL